jgi:hypothetical protein
MLRSLGSGKREELRMTNGRKERQFNREALTRFEHEIRRTKDAAKALGSAWEALVLDVVFKNMAPDFEYVDDLERAFSDMFELQCLIMGDHGALSNLTEVRRRFNHDHIVVPRSGECGFSAPTPKTVRESLGPESAREHNGGSEENDRRSSDVF